MLLHQIVGDKLPPGLVHHPLVKVGHDHIPDTVVPPHQLRPVQGGAEQGDRRGLEDQVLRMGIKGDRRRDGSQFGRLLPHPAQQGAVAQVNAVKKAQGDHTSCLCPVHCLTPRKNF